MLGDSSSSSDMTSLTDAEKQAAHNALKDLWALLTTEGMYKFYGLPFRQIDYFPWQPNGAATSTPDHRLNSGNIFLNSYFSSSLHPLSLVLVGQLGAECKTGSDNSWQYVFQDANVVRDLPSKVEDFKISPWNQKKQAIIDQYEAILTQPVKENEQSDVYLKLQAIYEWYRTNSFSIEVLKFNLQARLNEVLSFHLQQLDSQKCQRFCDLAYVWGLVDYIQVNEFEISETNRVQLRSYCDAQFALFMQDNPSDANADKLDLVSFRLNGAWMLIDYYKFIKKLETDTDKIAALENKLKDHVQEQIVLELRALCALPTTELNGAKLVKVFQLFIRFDALKNQLPDFSVDETETAYDLIPNNLHACNKTLMQAFLEEFNAISDDSAEDKARKQQIANNMKQLAELYPSNYAFSDEDKDTLENAQSDQVKLKRAVFHRDIQAALQYKAASSMQANPVSHQEEIFEQVQRACFTDHLNNGSKFRFDVVKGETLGVSRTSSYVDQLSQHQVLLQLRYPGVLREQKQSPTAMQLRYKFSLLLTFLGCRTQMYALDMVFGKVGDPRFVCDYRDVVQDKVQWFNTIREDANKLDRFFHGLFYNELASKLNAMQALLDGYDNPRSTEPLNKKSCQHQWDAIQRLLESAPAEVRDNPEIQKMHAEVKQRYEIILPKLDKGESSNVCDFQPARQFELLNVQECKQLPGSRVEVKSQHKMSLGNTLIAKATGFLYFPGTPRTAPPAPTPSNAETPGFAMTTPKGGK